MGTVQLLHQQQILLIRSVCIFYGYEATDALAQQIAAQIQQHWNEPQAIIKLSPNSGLVTSYLSSIRRYFSNTDAPYADFNAQEWLVQFQIEGFAKPSLQPEDVWYNTDPANNYFRIEASSPTHISFVDGVGSNTGYLKLDNLLQTSTTAAHEYGHTLGLDHPPLMDIRGLAVPGIMYPRGTICDPHLQYDSQKNAGEPGGTLNPHHRKVLQQDIDALQLHRLQFNRKGIAVLGAFTSVYHPFYTAGE